MQHERSEYAHETNGDAGFLNTGVTACPLDCPVSQRGVGGTFVHERSCDPDEGRAQKRSSRARDPKAQGVLHRKVALLSEAEIPADFSRRRESFGVADDQEGVESRRRPHAANLLEQLSILEIPRLDPLLERPVVSANLSVQRFNRVHYRTENRHQCRRGILSELVKSAALTSANSTANVLHDSPHRVKQAATRTHQAVSRPN